MRPSFGMGFIMRCRSRWWRWRSAAVRSSWAGSVRRVRQSLCRHRSGCQSSRGPVSVRVRAFALVPLPEASAEGAAPKVCRRDLGVCFLVCLEVDSTSNKLGDSVKQIGP
ncbi:hypothetical protein V5799_019419 [Amblyomma americanum]|uniref:Uncharacterized protein n=1 Tax=Amblyomma americanum TaxID=6943 RepID=A0AAQ4EWU4_AMBAM